MTARARVLVTDMEERAALATCRGLHAAGYRVVGAASSRAAAGLRSRACEERALLPDPRSDAAPFATAVAELVEARRIDLVVPSTDAALLALSDDAARRAMDKLELARAAARAGLPVPETIVCTSEEEAADAARLLGFPLVVKPQTSVVAAGGARRQQPSAVAADEDELRRALPPAGTTALLQRFRPDTTVYSCGGVVHEGRLLGFAYSRYLRTWRPAGGSAAFSETIDPPAGLEDAVLDVVGELGWEGLFELELIGDERPRHAIDLNPRPYGSMALAIAAGVNLPALWCDAVLGRSPKPARSQPGYRYRFEEADLRHLGWQLRHGRPRAALALIVPRRRTTHAFWRASDPLPAVAEAFRLARKATSRLTGTTLDRTPARLRSREAL